MTLAESLQKTNKRLIKVRSLKKYDLTNPRQKNQHIRKAVYQGYTVPCLTKKYNILTSILINPLLGI